MKKSRGTLFLIVGPSRVGKDSIMHGLMRRSTLRLKKLVTYTTRSCRPNETPGRSYHFVSEQEFEQRLKRGEFLEWAPVRGYKFATPKEPLRTWLRQGKKVLQQIDVRGAKSLIKIIGPAVFTIFILPGSLDDLKQRLRQKIFFPKQRRIRWQETINEIAMQKEFDFRLVNKRGHLAEAINEAVEVIRAVR